MECYSGAHVIEALFVGGFLAIVGTVAYYRRFSAWAKKIRESL
jgi:hypothetical protein